MSQIVYVVVEGSLDAAVSQRIVSHAGGAVGTVMGKKGVDYIRDRISSFNLSARGIPILTLVDLMDTRFDCPVEAVRAWLPHRNKQMLLRFVVREIESWILADRRGIARFLGIRTSTVPHHAESLPDPKRVLVDLARTSRFASLKRDIVPDDPTQNAQGPAYTVRLQKFIREQWDLEAASENAESLRRCIRAVRRMREEK